MELIRRFIREDEGGQTVEYALVLTLVAVVAVVGLTAAGNAINDWWQAVADKIGEMSQSVDSVQVPGQ